MNIKKLYNKMTFWKNLNLLDSKELISLCKQDFYKRTFILVTNGNLIWHIEFDLNDVTNIATNKIYSEFNVKITLLNLNPIDKPNYINSFMRFTIKNDEFNNLKDALFKADRTNFASFNVNKYCLGQDAYNMLIENF